MTPDIVTLVKDWLSNQGYKIKGTIHAPAFYVMAGEDYYCLHVHPDRVTVSGKFKYHEPLQSGANGWWSDCPGATYIDLNPAEINFFDDLKRVLER